MKYNVIVEEHFFEDKIEELKKNDKRIYEVWESISWELGRDPLGRSRQLMSDNKHYILETGPLDQDEPGYWILFRYEKEERKVYLLSIAPVPVQKT